MQEDAVEQLSKLLVQLCEPPVQPQLVHVRLPKPPRAMSHVQVVPDHPEMTRMQLVQSSDCPSMFVRQVLSHAVVSGEPQG